MQKARQISVISGIVNFLALYTIGIICFVIPEKIGPYQRGFYCDDESLRMHTKPNTVFAKDLFLATVSLSFLTIVICELYLYLGSTPEALQHYRWYSFSIPSFIVNTSKFYGYYHFGFVLQIIFNQIAKYFVGRLRPHFMDMCRPTPGFVCTEPNQYITNYTCIEPRDFTDTHGITLPQHDHYLLEVRQSFFSGHAASSFYFAVFISISLLIIGSLVSYTRIMDNFHHLSDVLFGVLYGMTMGYITVKYIMGLFIYKDGHIAVENPQGIRVFANFVRPEIEEKND